MRNQKYSIVTTLLALAVALPTLAWAAGCLGHSSPIGEVKLDRPLAPASLPGGAKFAIYYGFHTWCPECREQPAR